MSQRASIAPLLLALGLLVLIAASAAGQCPGSYPPPAPPYEGPAGAIEPTPGRETGPRPDPGTTPDPVNPGTTERPGLPTGGITPRTGATSPRTGGVTPGRRRKATARQDLSRWEYWWDLNKDTYLWKARRGTGTEDGSFTLGASSSPTPDAAGPAAGPEVGTASIEKMLPVLLKGMEESACGPRVSAILSLGRTRHASSLAAILSSLRDDCEQARHFAVLALGAHGDPIVVPMLRDILRDTPNGRRIVGGDRIRVRLRALAALSLGLSGDGKASPPLREALAYSGREAEIARSAAVALGVLGATEAVPDLLEALARESTDRLVRVHALAALGPIGERSALPAVLEHLRREASSDLVRSAVLAAGGLATAEDDEVVRALKRIALEGRDPLTSSWALISLGQIGGTEARRTLLRSLVNRSRPARSHFAALGLGILYFEGKGSPRDRVQDTFRVREALLDTRNESTRGCLAIALGLMDDQGSIGLLAGLLRSRTPELKGHAAESLGLLRAHLATPAITGFLWEKGSPVLSQRAARSLGLVATEKTVQAIQEELSRSRRGIDSRGASLSLGLIGEPSCVESLCRLATDSSRATEREVAFYAMGLWADRVHSPDRVPDLYRFKQGCNYGLQFPSLRVLIDIL